MTIATEHDSLHWFLVTHSEPITFAELWRQLGVLRRQKAPWPAETPEQLRAELRALAKHGLATTWSEVVDGEPVEMWRGEYVAVKADSQRSLFG